MQKQLVKNFMAHVETELAAALEEFYNKAYEDGRSDGRDEGYDEGYEDARGEFENE